MNINEMIQACLDDSQRLLPETFNLDLGHMSLGLAAEAGLAAAVIRDIGLGVVDASDLEAQRSLAWALAGVFQYWGNIMGLLGFDGEALFQLKRSTDNERFGGNDASSSDSAHQSTEGSAEKPPPLGPASFVRQP